MRGAQSRANLGIFQTDGDCLRRTPADSRGWHHAELRRELDWFNDRLEAPDRFFYRACRRAERSGICWFRDSATDHITRARYMAWLLTEIGTPIRIRRDAMPGSILWEDRHQVVALPPSRVLNERAGRAH